MSRTVVAEALDLSRLPPPTTLTLDLEADLAARIARLGQAFADADITWDVEDLEFDPAVIIHQADNYRETEIKSAINDRIAGNLLAKAIRGDLDQVAYTLHGVERMAGETDDRYRLRAQLEAQNRSGGRLSGYRAEALRASIEVADVGAWVDRSNPLEPTVRLAIQATTETGEPSAALVQAVSEHMLQENVRQATDVIAVQAVRIVRYALVGTVYHRPGPDPSILVRASETDLAAFAAERHAPHRDVPLSAAHDAAMVPGAERFSFASLTGDIAVENGELAYCEAITVTAARTDG